MTLTCIDCGQDLGSSDYKTTAMRMTYGRNAPRDRPWNVLCLACAEGFYQEYREQFEKFHGHAKTEYKAATGRDQGKD